MTRLTIAEARTLSVTALSAHGYTADEASIIADHLIDCELRGVGYGGLARALSVIERVATSGRSATGMSVVHESPVSAQICGGDEVGYLVATRATDLAIEKARSSGIAVVGANNTWYTGMFSYYLERVTAAGLVGCAAGSGGHIVAPHGSSEARFSTNPIAFGFPCDPDPIIWDIGTSAVMLAEVLLAHRLGHDLPEGLAYDKDGAPTTAPIDFIKGGALGVWGGHKGSGLGLVVQMLGMLAGAAAAPQGLTDCGFLLVAIDPYALGVQDLPLRIAEYAVSVRAARPLPGGDAVRMPFDRSASRRRAALADGHIEIEDQIHTELAAAARHGRDISNPHTT